MSDNSKNIYKNKIQKKLLVFTKKYYLKELFRGSIINLCLGVSLILIFALVEYFMRFSSSSRLFLLLSYSTILILSIGKFIVWPLLKLIGVLKSISNEKASEIIGNHFPEVQDQLKNLLELQNDKIQNELVIASINQKAKNIAPFEFKEAISFKEVFKFARWAALPLFLVILITSWNAEIISNSAKRIVQYDKVFTPENPFKFKINNNLSVIRHDNFNLEIKFTSNKVPNDVYLIVGNNKFRLVKKNKSNFVYKFRNIQKDVNFKLKTGKYYSSDYKLLLIEKPIINKLSVNINYPEYTLKNNDLVRNSGDVTVPEGSEVIWTIESDFVKKIHFKIDDKVTLIPTLNDTNIFQKTIYENCKYSINPEGENEIFGEQMDYRVVVVKDAYPKIKLKRFQDSINPLMLFHSGIVADDYGLKKLTFNFHNKDTSGVVLISIPKGNFQYQFNHGLNIRDLGFNIGDEFSYYFEIFDNDGINGSKSSKSNTETFKVPTERDITILLSKNNESIKDQINKNIEEAKELQKEFDKIKKMVLNKPKMDWQDKTRLNQFLSHQRQFENRLEKLQFEQQKNNFQKDQLSPQEEDLLMKQEQINKLFEQLMDGETKKLYEELEKLMNEFKDEKAKETLEKINMSNEELEKELDRTLEMFKQMEFDEKLEKTINKLNKLSKEQGTLSEETKKDKKSTDEALQKKQKEINAKFEDFQKDIEDLKKTNENLENKRKLENTQEDEKNIKEEQQKSIEELEKRNKKKAAKNQKKAADEMNNLAQSMQKMQKQNQEEQEMEDINSLRQILENLISLSVEQEELMQILKKTNRYDPLFPKLATKQGDLMESAKIIEDSLLSLSKRQIMLQTIINKEITDIKYNMNKSIDLLRERQNFESAVKQQYVMTSANNLALLLDESLQQMQQQMKNSKPGSGSCKKPGGSSPKSGMADIKKMQQQLSEQIKKMMKEMQGGKKPGKKGENGQSGIAKSLAKMSAEQNAIKEQLKKLNNQQKKQGKSGLGEMKELLKQMEENEYDILNKNITRETIMRQEQIMSKLLKADNSIRERELEEKRKSKKGKSNFSRNPEDFTPYKIFESKEIESLRTIPSSFNLFYKRRISEYFNTFKE